MGHYKFGPYEYESLDCLTSGDYAPGGSVAVANQRTIDAAIADGEATSAGSFNGSTCVYGRKGLDDLSNGEDVLILLWPYLTEEYLIRCDDGASEWARRTLARLYNYPLLDDEEHSRVEMEWQDESMPDAMHDLARGFSDEGRDAWDALTEDEQHELFRKAEEETNTYWYHENNYAYIDTARLLGAPCLSRFM